VLPDTEAKREECYQLFPAPSAKAVLPSGKLGVGAAKFGLRLGNEVLPMAKAEVFKASPDLRSNKAGPGDTGAGLSKE
jgi:hypothetical protein